MPEPTSSSTPTSPTFDPPASMEDDSTMDITSVPPDMRPGESEALNILNPPLLEEQEVTIDLDSPPASSPVAFIGINYVPDSANSQVSSHRLPPHPTPWDSVALQSVDGNAATRHSSFPPTPCVSACLQYYSLGSYKKYRQVKRSVPVSSYYFGPPPPNSAYFTPPVGQIGVHHPREIVRVERDYSGGEVVQFSSTYPLEFEGRVGLFPFPFRLRLAFAISSLTCRTDIDNANPVPGEYQCYQRDSHLCSQPVALRVR